MSVNSTKHTEFLISRMNELPTLPTVIDELARLINNPMSSRTEIVNLIQNDQSLTSKVLRLINSGFYAIPGGVKTLDRAIMLLGLDQVYQLVLSTSIINSLTTKAKTFDVKKFWQHSFGTAASARFIGSALGHHEPHVLFTAGLIHDIGKVVLAIIAPDQLEMIATTAKEQGLSFAQAEEKIDAPRHVMSGFMLSQKWNFPPIMQSCIRYHHAPASTRGHLSLEINSSIDIIALSNGLMHQMDFGDSGYSIKPEISSELLGRLSLDKEKLNELVAGMKAELESASRFLEIIGV